MRRKVAIFSPRDLARWAKLRRLSPSIPCFDWFTSLVVDWRRSFGRRLSYCDAGGRALLGSKAVVFGRSRSRWLLFGLAEDRCLVASRVCGSERVVGRLGAFTEERCFGQLFFDFVTLTKVSSAGRVGKGCGKG